MSSASSSSVKTRKEKSKNSTNCFTYILIFIGALVLGAVSTYLFIRLVNKESFSNAKQSQNNGLPDGRNTTSSEGQQLNKPGTLIKEMLIPKDIKPTHYDLILKAYLPGYGAKIPAERNLTFDGKLIVNFHVEKTIDTITLNAIELNFTLHNSFVESEGKRIGILSINNNNILEKVIFKLASFVSGSFRLHISYQGPIRVSLNGLYQTIYTDSQGRTKIGAVSQMEPTYARKMVPCYDEPEWKATWNVTIIHPKGTNAVSNGVEVGQPTEMDDFLTTTFSQTPKMSTYLLAIFISDFEYIENYTSTNVRFRIYSRPEAKKTARYALKAGIKCLEALEKFYNISFPLKKQDMIALPDFAMGAMENWGMITYRETALLYDEKNYSFGAKKRVATVIAHELAHMWFGNLVTMKWWTDIWLNEGFASLIENIGVDFISDDSFDMENDFVTAQHAVTLTIDSTRSSHPIITHIETKEQINDAFDAISYRKGASILKCISRIMKQENFLKGVTNYLKEFSYKNADHSDLFRHLDNTVPENITGPNGKRFNVTEFALKWTTQMGYPYLTLDVYNGTHYSVKQERYLIHPNATENTGFANPKYGYIWDVPVWYQRTDRDKIEFDWLPYKEELYLKRYNEGYILNADSYAITRINFDTNGWKMILFALKNNSSIFSPRTKYRILSDVFSMAAIGKTNYSIAFEFVKYIVKEKHRLPWQAFFGEMDKIHAFLGTSSTSLHYKKYMTKLLDGIVNIENGKIDDILARISSEKMYIEYGIQVTQWLKYCAMNKPACQKDKTNIFMKDYLQHCDKNNNQSSECTKVHPEIRGSIYCHAVENMGDEVFRLIKSKYMDETLSLESKRLLSALMCTKDVPTLKWLTEETLKKNGIFRRQDVGTIFYHLAANDISAEFLIDFLLDNWDNIHTSFAEDQSILNHIIESCTGNIHTSSHLQKLKNFVNNKATARKYHEFIKSEQLAEKRIEWLKKYASEVSKLLQTEI